MALIISGVFDGPRSGGTPKGIELYATADIPDLSIYGISSANNGNPSPGQEFALSGSASAGDHIYIASEDVQFSAFFGFSPDFVTGAANINGDDAIELYLNGNIIDYYGVVGVDGTGEVWDHMDGWAYRNNNAGPNTTFTPSEWTFSGPDALDDNQTNADAAGDNDSGTGSDAVPVGTYECFLAGTQILSDKGEVAVETLKIGDLVKTAQGELVAIKWIGYQTFEEGTPSHPFRTFPIQIKAGALGGNLPSRDLFVSPDHAILVDGLLINAGALENGVSIIATQPEESFTYYHIELEQHSLLIAEGTYAESFLPQNQGRDTFDNGDEYETLYPNHNILSLLPMSFPRVSSKRQLPRSVAKRLMDVADTLPGIEALAIA